MAIGDAGAAGTDGDQLPPLQNLNAVQDSFQVVGFVTAAQKAGKSLKSKRGTGAFGLDDLLIYTNDPIPAPLLKLSADNASRAVQMFNSILAYQKDTAEKLTDQQRVETVQKLLHQGLKRPELKDELYMQLIKQTRGNIVSESRLRAWELLYLVAATMPPSKDFISIVSPYVNVRSQDQEELAHIQRVALKTWNSLKRTARAGPRRMLPTPEEINSCLGDKKLSTVVFFMDDTFDTLEYEVTTTVQEASGKLAQIIKLQNYSTFTLYECKRSAPTKAAPQETLEDEYFCLDDNRYIADILVDLKAKNDKAGKDASSKLVFRKRLFRGDEDEIDEMNFIGLSYIQCQHDFVQGHYPVVKEDAAQMCALQMQAGHASTLMDDDEGIMMCVEKYVTKQILMTRPREEWKVDVGHRYKSLAELNKDQAKIKFLSILRSLPYGASVFFPCKREQDPTGLLPPKCIIGVNSLGVHFFRPLPKEYLHSVELKDVVQFGSTPNMVLLKMKVAEVSHIFQFETRQGAELCYCLQTHINDIMTKRYIKAKAEAEEGGEGEGAARVVKKRASFNPKYEQHLLQLQRACEDAQNQVDQMQKAYEELRQEKEHALTELTEVNIALKKEEQTRNMLQDQLRILEKSSAANKAEIEINRAKAAAASAAAAQAGAELAAIDMDKFAQLEKDLEKTSEQLAELADKNADMEKRQTQLTKEKELVEAKLKRIEKAMEQENKELRERLEGVVGNVKEQMESKELKLKEVKEEMLAIETALQEEKEATKKFMADNNIMELQEIRKMQEAVETKAAENQLILAEQENKINDIERKYREEQVTRKRLFNALEDIKGKIRVYCRVRPLLQFEKDKGEKFALIVPNDITIQHMWKDEKKPREYQFDQIFVPGTPQADVFEDTRHCVQSAVDGYNVCIFAYGQTGSGKTFTIYGNEKEPGLTPRGVKELFTIINENRQRVSCVVQYYMLELYQDSIQDLLLPPSKRSNPPKLEIKKDTKGMVYVQGSTVVDIRDYDHLMSTIDFGQKNRHVSATSMNKESSRSHLIMSIIVESTNLRTQNVTKGKLTFVDLAGSERIKKSNAAGEQLKEAQAINKSLSALGNVISALATDNPHVPYRDHKLTMVMSDSLGGSAKTLMFVNCSPAEYNLDETQNSLNYALRVSKIKNLVKTSEDPRDIQKLKKQLEYWKAEAGKADRDRNKLWSEYEVITDTKDLEAEKA